MESGELLRIFPVHIREGLRGVLQQHPGIEEIRIRVNQPLLLYDGKNEYFLKKDAAGMTRDRKGAYVACSGDISEMLVFISRYSLYAFEEELRNGYITLAGGHRAGLCGQAVCQDGRVQTIRNISYLNIRLGHEKTGCGSGLVKWLYKEDAYQSGVYNTLLVSPPGKGKTTLLRDLVRLLSDGCRGHAGLRVSVVDERSEIAACYQGVPQNDVGMRTDVLDACPKSVGMYLMLRTMSPQVLAVDELGLGEDIQAVEYAIHCGCSILGSVHAADLEELAKKPGLSCFVERGYFERYLLIRQQPGGERIYEIYDARLERLC